MACQLRKVKMQSAKHYEDEPLYLFYRGLCKVITQAQGKCDLECCLVPTLVHHLHATKPTNQPTSHCLVGKPGSVEFPVSFTGTA